ncbi:MAG: EVE domain-containing protein [Planctomycetota bacterium]
MARWLIKSEPGTFSIQDLARAPKKTTSWEGVRNYQARNFLRAMKRGDLAIFYHSNAEPPAAVGIAKVVREAYPDPTAWDPNSDYHDPKAGPENPLWSMVDVQLVEIFPRELPLEELRGVKALAGMELLRRGSRLSVTPVTAAEFRVIEKLAHAKPAVPAAKAARANAAKKRGPPTA